MANPPLIAFPRVPRTDRLAGVPLAELKKHLLVYVASPPGPKTAAKVLEAYFQRVGDPFVEFGSTAFASAPRPWNPGARQQFLLGELPRLRTGRDWGYWLSDGRNRGSSLVMFHGFRPVSEPGKASFFRFEFDWEFDDERLVELARDVLGLVECVGGVGGYLIQGQPRGPLARESWDLIYAWARRYWGVHVLDIDATVDHALTGIDCVAWLTLVGPSLESRQPEAVAAARRAATEAVSTSGGTLLRIGPRPVLGDRNLQWDLSEYQALARALEPVQISGHPSFGNGYESRWDEEVTQAWLHRFSDPDAFANG